MKNLRVLKIFLMIAVVCGAAYYLRANWNDFRSLNMSAPHYFIPAALAYLGFFFCNGLFTRQLLKIFRIHLKTSEWFGMSVLNTFLNFVMPGRAGLVINGIYLKKKHNLSFASYTASVAATYILTFLVNSILALSALFGLFVLKNQTSELLLYFFLCSTVGLGSLLFIPIPQLTGRLNIITSSWGNIRRELSVIIPVCLIAAGNVIFCSIVTWSEFRAFAADIDVFSSVVLTVFSMFSLFINIMPAGLGVREAFSAISSANLGIDPVLAVAISLADRGLLLCLSAACSALVLLASKLGTKHEG